MFAAQDVLAGWSGTGEVTDIYSHNGYHIVDTTIADNPCGRAGRFYWPTSDGDAKDMLSLALAAMMSQKSVSVAYDENGPACNWGGAISTHFRISR